MYVVTVLAHLQTKEAFYGPEFYILLSYCEQNLVLTNKCELLVLSGRLVLYG